MNALQHAALALVSNMALLPPAFALEPQIDLYVEDSLRPILHGSTNLPDGAALIVTLSREASDYMAQSNVTGKQGHYKTERFSQGKSPLNPGRYEIEVSMSLAYLQPANVQAVIGDHGQNMTGRFVTEGGFGGGQVFEYKAERQLWGRPTPPWTRPLRRKPLLTYRSGL